MTVENYRAAESAQSYYRCSPLNEQELVDFKLNDEQVGIWQLHSCPGDHEFDFVKQGCTDKSKLRRQQSNCQMNPNGFGCHQSCQATPNVYPQPMMPCDWSRARLQNFGNDPSSFMNCAPKPASPCGQWIMNQCMPGSVFDIKLQLCIPEQVIQNGNVACPSNSMPVCQCSRNSLQNMCPGRSMCTPEYRVCCQPIYTSRVQQPRPPPMPIVNSNMQSACFGINSIPIGMCSSLLTCPPGSTCNTMSGVCCTISSSGPIPVMQPQIGGGIVIPQMQMLPPQIPQQPLVNRPQTMPIPVYQNQPPPTPVVQQQLAISCPNGMPGSQPCGFMEQCPSGSGCFRGVCCKLFCPTGQDATGFCGQNTIGLFVDHYDFIAQASCISGCCCQQQEPIRLPTCRSGLIATAKCSSDQECGPGMECLSGGCCPVPFCPSGVQAVGRCPSGSGCPSATICANGLCCPSPRCSSGVIAVRICVSSSECGIGFECANGGCCPLPLCPSNQIGSQRCPVNGCCCPAGEQCMNGVCCPLPACPNGILAATVCGQNGVCPQGMECINGGCCPLPQCPSGVQPSQRCNGVNCPNGQICENGVCCPRPICSDGQLAIQLCSYGNSCPIGYVCEGRACCAEPVPLCPSGGRASQKCDRGIECPPGYGCTALGGCCLLSLQPSCPPQQNPISQCASSNNRCPAQTSCNMGTCCQPTPVKSYSPVIPGMGCQSTANCNGYQSNCAQCIKSICVCINGAASNGAMCQQFSRPMLAQARSACDQYGSPCKFVLSTARRKPLFAPVANNISEPLWFAVTSKRRCLLNGSSNGIDSDSTCLPNEKCIYGECRMKLWPGEYGCTSDLECSSRCPNTFCAAQSDKAIPQCQCISGKLLYGRCLKNCPKGFRANGAYCEHIDEDHFWKDSEQQNSLYELLNSEMC